MIFLEVVVILLIIGLQARVYWQNRERAATLASLFPDADQLYLQTSGNSSANPPSTPLQGIREGYFYRLDEEPGKLFRLLGRDGEFFEIEERDPATGARSTFLLTEKELIALPAKEGFALDKGTEEATTDRKSLQLPAARHSSAAFQELLQEVQAFLKRNEGTVTGLEGIRDMSDRRLETETANLQNAVATPLYIGLLGTFLGVILGLGAIVTDGVTEEAIGQFLLGVVVAMGGSFFGLLFTLLGNAAFRNARQKAAAGLNTWLNFLQIQLLPRLQSDLSSSLGNLKVVLDEFNNDFFRRVTDFKEVFENLNQYVGMQEKFLTALQQSDYSQLTEANLKFFEQIQQNETLFERFGQYLQRLNESMDTGREAAADIREIVGQLRQLDDVQGYLRQNEELIRKQLGYLGAHQDKMDQLTNGIQQHFIEAGDEINKLVQRRMEIMRKEEQDAGEQLRQHFQRLKQENVYQKIADQLQPIEQMEADVRNLRELFSDTLKHLLETQQYIIRKINQDGLTQSRLLQEMEQLNGHIRQLSEKRNWFQRLMGGR